MQPEPAVCTGAAGELAQCSRCDKPWGTTGRLTPANKTCNCNLCLQLSILAVAAKSASGAEVKLRTSAYYVYRYYVLRVSLKGPGPRCLRGTPAMSTWKIGCLFWTGPQRPRRSKVGDSKPITKTGVHSWAPWTFGVLSCLLYYQHLVCIIQCICLLLVDHVRQKVHASDVVDSGRPGSNETKLNTPDADADADAHFSPSN
ncbi:predicted protein [Pyrenophora tritici-repentis Pt-1C-BFP]|uniref:Uncharacterized protein n=1 Tax=Pyrenophora tritici-repentis (strain Pt-1C-BFP) TaxID=426418 RepID=B2W6G8_PYRTR|nr:uncharacterized protein PTRG_05406 [Pyrenophora tritici-repentis Pt-1C-BFP]EDU48326.1 predicted protein [Pyrenophora tritici-repentis Pt-1C-BFP]